VGVQRQLSHAFCNSKIQGANEEDLSVATRSIKPRAIKIFQRARALEKLTQQMFNRQLQLLFDFED